MAYDREETIAQRIKRAGLPESHDVHWSQRKKADVVRAVREDLIEFSEVRERYLLSRVEFRSWERQVDKQKRKKDVSEPA